MSTDRFDFEQQIMTCWNICEDIKAITKMHDIRALSEDELLQMKFEILFNMFESMIQNDQVK
jgi:hypothetical protein